jgi:hypothetical protein
VLDHADAVWRVTDEAAHRRVATSPTALLRTAIDRLETGTVDRLF